MDRMNISKTMSSCYLYFVIATQLIGGVQSSDYVKVIKRSPQTLNQSAKYTDASENKLAKVLDGSTSVNVAKGGSVSRTNCRIGGIRTEPFYDEVIIECPSFLSYETDDVYIKTTGTYVDFTVEATSAAPVGTHIIRVEYTFYTSSSTGPTYTLTVNVNVYDPTIPPVADFTATPATGVAPLTVQFTSQTSGIVTSYYWEFGDGSTSTYVNPSHQYTNYGSWTVKLTVTGPSGTGTKTKTDYIITQAPVPTADFSGNPINGKAPLTVQFNSQTTGIITSYSWVFGDGGTSTKANPSHVYTQAGSWTVKFTVNGPGGTAMKTKNNYITTQEPTPTADFTATPTTGIAPLKVQFTSQTTGTITYYAWDFGDGSTSALANPSHSYNNGGGWTIKLTVTGPGGSASKTKINYITTQPPAPTTDFTANPTTGTAPLTVQFTSQTTGVISSYLWDFGDGRTSTITNPTHLYTFPGIYSVKLTVTGPSGSTCKIENDFILVRKDIVLSEGWNLVSWNVDTPNDSTYLLLKNIDSKLIIALGVCRI